MRYGPVSEGKTRLTSALSAIIAFGVSMLAVGLARPLAQRCQGPMEAGGPVVDWLISRSAHPPDRPAPSSPSDTISAFSGFQVGCFLALHPRSRWQCSSRLARTPAKQGAGCVFLRPGFLRRELSAAGQFDWRPLIDGQLAVALEPEVLDVVPGPVPAMRGPVAALRRRHDVGVTSKRLPASRQNRSSPVSVTTPFRPRPPR